MMHGRAVQSETLEQTQRSLTGPVNALDLGAVHCKPSIVSKHGAQAVYTRSKAAWQRASVHA